MAPKISNEELHARLREREVQQLEQLADHPNPAITVWRMLPGHNYGAVFEGTKTGKGLGRLLGYEIKNLVGKPKFMPNAVAKRLVDDGKITFQLGGAWVRVNEDWKPR